MAKVKIDTEAFLDLQEKLGEAQEAAVDVLNFWGDHFDDMYQAFFGNSGADTCGASVGSTGSGRGTDALDPNCFMYQLYARSESNWYEFIDGFTIAASTVGLVAVALDWNPVGWVLTAISVLCSLLGLALAAVDMNTVHFSYVSRDVFQADLYSCWVGDDDNYRRLLNIYAKVDNLVLSMLEIMSKVDTYQKEYADFSDSAAGLGLKTSTADDGITLKTIDTYVVIDGEKVELSTSEAINAFFTYESTVMSAEFEAAYLADQGINVNYDDIVKNANGFMKSTVKSQLYSHEFIEAVLPAYKEAGLISYNDGVNAVAATNGLTTDQFSSALSKVPGGLGSYTGLLGGAFLGTLVDPNKNNGGGNNGGGNNGGGNNGGGNNGGGNNGDSPIESPSKPEPSNEVKIPEKTEVKIPEKVEEPKVEKNYDDLAREKYESQGTDKIDEHRTEIIDAVNKKIDEGDYDSIKKKLKEYGYSDADIEEIIKDRQSIITAILAGDEQAELLKIAKEMAEKDGVKDFSSDFEKAYSYKDTIDGTCNELLVSLAANEDLTKEKGLVDTAFTAYNEKVVTANAAIVAATTASTSMTDIMKKYSEKYGTEDTTKWDEDSAKEYAEAVKTYNTKVEEADKAVKEQEAAKKAYDEEKDKYDEMKQEFLDKIKEENDRTDFWGNVDDGESGDSDGNSGTEGDAGEDINHGDTTGDNGSSDETPTDGTGDNGSTGETPTDGTGDNGSTGTSDSTGAVPINEDGSTYGTNGYLSDADALALLESRISEDGSSITF